MTSSESTILYEEARYLHFSMFGRYPDNVTLSYYVSAHAEISLLRFLSEQELNTVRVIIAHSLDATGIEPWLRGKRMRHALSAKMLLLAYLAECDSCHPEFSRCASTGRMALLSIGRAALKAGFCLLRGRIQKVCYGLV